MVDDGPEAVQFNVLDVDAAHAGDRVAHDPVDSVLVLCLVGPRSEGVAKSIEPNPSPLEAEVFKEIAKAEGLKAALAWRESRLNGDDG